MAIKTMRQLFIGIMLGIFCYHYSLSLLDSKDVDESVLLDSLALEELLAHPPANWTNWISLIAQLYSLPKDEPFYETQVSRSHQFIGAMEEFTRYQLRTLPTRGVFDGCSLVCDLGGGSGLLLDHLRQHVGCRGLLVDASAAAIRRYAEKHTAVQEGVFAAAGKRAGATALQADLFSLPERLPCECAVMKGITSDYNDSRVSQLLLGLPPGVSSLFLVDHFLGTHGAAMEKVKARLHLLMKRVLGGKQRTVPEMAAICSAAGWDYRRHWPAPSSVTIIKATRRA